VAPCGDPNMYYDAEAQAILLCSEQLDELYSLSMGRGDTPEDGEALYQDAALFLLFHELGHAVVHIFDLPVTGREEDVADQLSAWILLTSVGEDEEYGILSALNAADFFAMMHEAQGQGEFWDEHSMDQQRHYNLLCWAYGYSPEITEAILEQPITDFLPRERAEQCQAEYQKMDDSFVRLLGEHYKGY